MRLLHERADGHAVLRAGELNKVGAGGPGEVVHVLRMIEMGGGSVAVASAAHEDSGRAQQVLLRHGHLHIVNSEIREEFRVRVILVAVPFPVNINADFRKPLAEKEKFLQRPVARHGRLRQLAREINVHDRDFSGRQRLGQGHAEDGAVVRVVVVRVDKLDARLKVFARGKLDALNLDKPENRLLEFTFFGARLFDETGLGVAECVEVEVELEFGDGRAGLVMPGEGLFAVEEFFCRIEFDVNVIVGDARAERLGENHRLGKRPGRKNKCRREQ